jgi:mRNA-degrading endonuclease RelE of RelBE toxin-antitoxin system
VIKVNASAQILEFCRSLPPEPRKKLRQALRGLEREQGDIKSLEGKLAGYHRLRCGSYRVIFALRMRGGKKEVDCIFVEHRSLVYEILHSAAHLVTAK